MHFKIQHSKLIIEENELDLKGLCFLYYLSREMVMKYR